MINDKINLLGDHPECTLTLCVHDNDGIRRPTVVVCPGGGYGCVCRDREGEPIAQYFYANGFNACVLEYTFEYTAMNRYQAIGVESESFRGEYFFDVSGYLIGFFC